MPSCSWTNYEALNACRIAATTDNFHTAVTQQYIFHTLIYNCWLKLVTSLLIYLLQWFARSAFGRAMIEKSMKNTFPNFENISIPFDLASSYKLKFFRSQFCADFEKVTSPHNTCLKWVFKTSLTACWDTGIEIRLERWKLPTGNLV